jgi:hypothetical protein
MPKDWVDANAMSPVDRSDAITAILPAFPMFAHKEKSLVIAQWYIQVSESETQTRSEVR